MKISFDRKADAAYTKLSEEKVDFTASLVGHQVLVDISKDSRVVGIQFLAVSQRGLQVDEVIKTYGSWMTTFDAFLLRNLSVVEGWEMK